MSQPTTPAEPFSPLDAIACAHADQELYAPLWQVADTGARVRALAGTCRLVLRAPRHLDDVDAPEMLTPVEGWKVHVSARLDRAHEVLDIVAEACFGERVSFKHLRPELFFLYLHHKHGPRQQSGKFCAAADDAPDSSIRNRPDAARTAATGLLLALSDLRAPGRRLTTTYPPQMRRAETETHDPVDDVSPYAARHPHMASPKKHKPTATARSCLRRWWSETLAWLPLAGCEQAPTRDVIAEQTTCNDTKGN
jgi:hypothetical protein